MTIEQQYIEIVDQCFADMLTVNATEPYIHAEYERHLRMARGALVLLTSGDENYAKALEEAFFDSNESMTWYLNQWSRDSLVQWAGIEPEPSPCECENSACSHNDNACSNHVDQSAFTMEFIGPNVCRACVYVMRKTHPEWITAI